MNITFGRIEDRAITYVELMILCEDGCSFDDDEYCSEITAIMGAINLNYDIDMIDECISNIDFSKYKKEDLTVLKVILRESGEWEDMRWFKYFVVDRINEEGKR